MSNASRKISPALFSLGLFCFFLPFITVSCRQEQLITLNGVELASGKEIQQPSLFGQPKTEKIPGEPLALFAMLSGLVGVGTSFIKAKKSAAIPAGAGAVGFILLLMLKSKIDDVILKQGQGFILVNYGLGFWLAFLIYVSAILVNIYSLLTEKDEQQSANLPQSNPHSSK